MMVPDSVLFRRRILLAEDEYLQAFDIHNELLDRGAAVIGPLSDLEVAIAEVKSEPRIDAAIIDVNLGGELVFPLVDDLVRRDIPIIFTTAYGPEVVPFRLRHLTLVEKPVCPAKLAEIVGKLIAEAECASVHLDRDVPPYELGTP
jgi:CheY-like chemotaxis protein